MTQVYTVHAPPDEAVSAEPAEQLIFVKEGFCWPALLIPPLWLISRRMWLVLVGWLAVAALILAGYEYLGKALPGTVDLLFWLLFALEANELRRWTLARRGWRFLGVAAGRNRDEAEMRFFQTRYNPAVAPRPRPQRMSVAAPAQAAVIGHFPKPGAAR
ncbi:MAG: DUF2628 domain-containing protein [Hyphomicrobiales bacterium]|nr:DUF2628 domain-containing protein [Hyphomicrobiales bacterium]